MITQDRERERGFRLPFLDRIPRASYDVEVADTGGAFRPDWRKQDPASDPREPFSSSGESNSTGTDHGWSNCTMTSAALGYAYEAGKQSGPWGGDMRHSQDDLSGGTDLYDAQVAWKRYGGHTLTIRNGAGWDAVGEAHAEGRAILIQGEGNVPGSEAFDGGHACIIGRETNADGLWLFGDPLASGWQWCSTKQIREWAQALDYDIMFAVGSAPEGNMPGLSLGNLRSFSGKVVMQAANASAIVVATKELVGMPVGLEKQAYMQAILGEKFGAYPAGTEVMVVGDGEAVVIRAQVEVIADSGEYVEAGKLYIKKT